MAVSFTATPRLSIIVKLPFAAPWMEYMASLMLMPIIEATSAARCMAWVVISKDSPSLKPLPWNRLAIWLAVDRYSLVDRPMR